MARQITFIHAADLHLGAPFRGLRALSPRWGERLVRAIPEAYGRVVRAAIQNEVDFVVIAGDIFDAERPSYADYHALFEGLGELDRAHIPVYLVPGNHDPYTSWERSFGVLPGNTVMLSDERPGYALYRRDGEPMCILAGRGYYNQSFPVDECVADGITRGEAVGVLGEEAKSAPFAVGVLHTGLDVDTAPMKAPVSQARLMGSDMDYWALGHIHARRLYPKSNPRMSFSGIIQGRDINETGPRGVNLVTLTEGRPNQVKFVPCASVVWQKLSVDIAECASLADVEQEVRQRLFAANSQAMCEEMCARVTLTGATPLHEVLARPGVVEDLREAINASYDRFFCDALVDETRMPRNYEALRAADLFPAVLMDVVEEERGDLSATRAFLQEEFLARGVSLSAGILSEAGDLLLRAQDDVLDLLERGGR